MQEENNQRHAGCQPRWSLPDLPSITLHNSNDLSAATDLRHTLSRKDTVNNSQYITCPNEQIKLVSGSLMQWSRHVRLEVQIHIDSLNCSETHKFEIPPLRQEISSNSAKHTTHLQAARDPSAVNTGNPPHSRLRRIDVRRKRFEVVSESHIIVDTTGDLIRYLIYAQL